MRHLVLKLNIRENSLKNWALRTLKLLKELDIMHKTVLEGKSYYWDK